MTKKYRISLKVYSSFLIFAILFNLMLLFASGHRVKLSIFYYLIPIYAILSFLLLTIYPKTSNNRKLILISILLLLGVSLYFAFGGLYLIFTGDLIIEFVIPALIFIGIFISSIGVLCSEILKLNKSTSH
ncbi:hypothetical protein GTZ96_014315 [Flavobacterium sp. BBQ-18]|nr:hypothetical protein [Flavobacterium undicola]